MKFCKNCGSELSENEKELQFCDNCKGALAEKENFTEDENISDAQSIEEPVAKKKKPFNKKALIIVLSSFVALILVTVILLTTVFAPIGTYLKARWHLLWKNYPEAHAELDSLGNDVILDSGHLADNFIIAYAKSIKTYADGNKDIKKFEYDEYGNLLSETLEDHDADGSIYTQEIRYQYDENGNRISEIWYRNGIKDHLSTKFEYDEYGNLTLYDSGYDALSVTYQYENNLAVSADFVIYFISSGKKEESGRGTLELKRDKQGYITEAHIVSESKDYDLDRVNTIDVTFKIIYDTYHYVCKLSFSGTWSYIEPNGEGEKTSYNFEREYKNNKIISIREAETEEYIGNNPEYMGEKSERSESHEYKYDSNGNLSEERVYHDGNLTEYYEYHSFDTYGNYDSLTFTYYNNYNTTVSVFEYTYKYEYDEYGNILIKKEYKDGELYSTTEYSDYVYYYKEKDQKILSIDVLAAFEDITIS